MSRERSKEQKTTFRVPLNQILTIEEMSPDICTKVIFLRIQQNLQEAKHPFHHKTANGAIVSTDPTLEYLISKLTDAPEAIPVDRNYYQH